MSKRRTILAGRAMLRDDAGATTRRAHDES